MSGGLGYLLRRIVGRHCREPAVADAVPPEIAWRDQTPPGGFGELFCPADESEPMIAAVNRIAAGSQEASDREIMRMPFAGPLRVRQSAFSAEEVAGGFRFRYPAGAPRRWITYCSKEPLTGDWAMSFDYTPFGEFKEQLQTDFGTVSLGDRLRFMVRQNRLLVFSRVEGGWFQPDDRAIPLRFEIGQTVRVRIETCGGVHSLSVGGRRLLSVRTLQKSDGYVLLIFYEDGVSRPIDFVLAGFRLERPDANGMV